LHESCVNRVTIENVKRRHGPYSPAAGPVDGKVNYPAPTAAQELGNPHGFDHHKSQHSKGYSSTNVPQYIYRQQQAPSQLNAFK